MEYAADPLPTTPVTNIPPQVPPPSCFLCPGNIIPTSVLQPPPPHSHGMVPTQAMVTMTNPVPTASSRDNQMSLEWVGNAYV